MSIDIQEKMAEVLMHWRHSSGPATPSDIADQLLAIEVPGSKAPDKCGYPKGDKCPRWCHGDITEECTHRVERDEIVKDWCLHIDTRPATVADMIAGKGVAE